MNKIALKNSLIELGATNPRLRPAIRPILAALAPKVASAESLLAPCLNSMGSYKHARYNTKISFKKVALNAGTNTATVIGTMKGDNGEFALEAELEITVKAEEGDKKGNVTVSAKDLIGEGSVGKGAKAFNNPKDCAKSLKAALDTALKDMISREMSLI